MHETAKELDCIKGSIEIVDQILGLISVSRQENQYMQLVVRVWKLTNKFNYYHVLL